MKRRQVSALFSQLSVGTLLGGLSISSYCEQCKSHHLFNQHFNREQDGKPN
jgi:hypothetical protein